MNRRLLRSMLSFDPFFHEPFFQPFFRVRQVPFQTTSSPSVKELKQEPIDSAEKVFNDFFSQTELNKQEKEFFDKHYPEKKKEPTAHEILGVSKEATQQEIKEAYREKALKYHPKVDSTPEGQQKFRQLAQAYDTLTSQKYFGKEEPVVSGSFFDNFHELVNRMVKQPLEEPAQQKQKVQSLDNYGDLYSESTYMENINGRKKVSYMKQYKKDGKLLKLKREENFKADGSKEVTEELDDGVEVKKKSFVENSSQGRLTH